MNTTHVFIARLSAMFFVLLFCSTAFGGSAKVDVCHIPPGDPDNFHTISISEKAVAAHLRHGDLEGACEVDPAVPCPCFTGLEAASADFCTGEENSTRGAFFGSALYATGYLLSNDVPTCLIQDSPSDVQIDIDDLENESCLAELRTACGS